MINIIKNVNINNVPTSSVSTRAHRKSYRDVHIIIVHLNLKNRDNMSSGTLPAMGQGGCNPPGEGGSLF